MQCMFSTAYIQCLALHTYNAEHMPVISFGLISHGVEIAAAVGNNSKVMVPTMFLFEDLLIWNCCM